MKNIKNLSVYGALELDYLDKKTKDICSEKSQDFSLVTYRDFVGRSKQLARILLYDMQNQAKLIMLPEERKKFFADNKKPNIEFCGLSIKYQSETVDMVINDKDRICMRGLAMCGLVWRCPICSMKILHGRQDQLNEYVKAHTKKERFIGFVTLTIPHGRKDELETTLNKLNNNYRGFQQTRFFKKLKSNIIGQVKALEITYTYQNGWHPHLHILYFYSDINKRKIQSIQKEIVSRWVSFRDNGALLRGQDYKICYDNDIVDYVSKWDVIKEVTAEQVKKSKGFTPFQILKKLALKDFPNVNRMWFLRMRFEEYITVTKGKHRLSISPKLVKSYPSVKNKKDEDLLNEIKVEALLMRFEWIVWLQVVKKRLQPHVINAYKMGGYEAVFNLLTASRLKFDVTEDSENKPYIF